MMEEPGSFSGNCNSPMPDLGPEASILISFAILFKDTAICFSTVRFYNGIMSGKSFKFIGCSDKRMPSKLSDINFYGIS
jgi:hypothetical protein